MSVQFEENREYTYFPVGENAIDVIINGSCNTLYPEVLDETRVIIDGAQFETGRRGDRHFIVLRESVMR